MAKVSQSTMLDDSFLDEDEQENPPAKILALIFFLWISQPLVLWGLGLCEGNFKSGFALSSLIIRYFFFLAGLHVVLLGPIIYFAYPELKKIKFSTLRKWALFLFLAPPLFSLGYFFSNIQHSGALFEFVMLTSLSLIMAINLFESSQNLSLFSIGLASTLFFQWFGVGDILGPFQPYYSLVPKSDLFYWGRVLLSALCLGLSLAIPRILEKKPRIEKPNPQNLSFIFMMFLGVALYFGLPWINAQYDATETIAFSLFDFLFIGFIPLLLIQLKPSLQAGKIGRFFKLILIGLFLFRTFEMMSFQSATLVSMSWTTYDLVAATLIGLSLL